MKQAIEKYRGELESIREAGTWREERVITTPQLSRIDTTQAKRVVNMCANNYLGLSDHSALIQAAKESYDRWGFGLSSVRFICGTQAIHKELEGSWRSFWAWTTPSSTPPASTPTAVSSRPCWGPRTR